MVSMRLFDLAKYLNAQLYGNGDILITKIASIDTAVAGDITFLSNNRLRKKLNSCKASAVILTKDNLSFCKSSALIVKNPYLTYAYLAQLMNNTPKPAEGISVYAVISPDVFLGQGVSIGANTIIESGVFLENNVIIGSGCFIGKNTRIGNNTCIWANVTIYHNIIIGKHCLIHSGTVIGADGFGYANDNINGNWVKIPQLGTVVIGDYVEIGSCTTIDRGSLDETIIGNGVIIDNQCQIAHNVIIGDNTAIAGGVIIAGGSKIGRCCMIGGASAINGHIEICDNVTITGMGMVVRSITEPGVYSSGVPLQKNNKWRRNAVLAMNLNSFVKRIKIIERKQ